MKIRLHLKIFVFVAIFIATRQIEIYGLIMIFAFLHEMGHMIAGIILGFKPCTLEIMPFGLSIGFEGKVENYNKKIGKASIITLKKMIIALSGPLTNLFFVLLFSIFKINIFGIERELIIYSNILLGIFNLIPIYPLDGGRVLKCVLYICYGKKDGGQYINTVSYITVVILTAIASITILYFKNIAIPIILIYLWYLVIREKKKYNSKRKIYERLKQLKEENYNYLEKV